MNSLWIFLGILVLLFSGVAWLLRNAIRVIGVQAAAHAACFATAYVKGAALIAIAMGSVFMESFQELSVEQAARMAWWGWAVLCWKPIAAGLAVLVAFLDRSAQRASEQRAATNPPFDKK